VVGLDGGYVRNWEDRKTNFEVIVGQSVPEDRDARYVGLVHGYDRKPKRRLFDVLKSQGLQPNQDVTSLTDGGEEIRASSIDGERGYQQAIRQTPADAVDQRGAHLLLQTRTRMLDGTLRPLFERWYPGLANDNPAADCQAAAA
jgi:hypothetical protein